MAEHGALMGKDGAPPVRSERSSLTSAAPVPLVKDESEGGMEAFEAGEIVTLLPCLHAFHRQCVFKWLGQDSTCPVCKEDLGKLLGQQESLEQQPQPCSSRRQAGELISGDHQILTSSPSA